MSSLFTTIEELFKDKNGLFLIAGFLGILSCVCWRRLKAEEHSADEPPLIPYKWPYIGHTLEFLKDSRAFFAKASEQSNGQPFTLFFLGSKYYVFGRPKDVEVVYGKFNNKNHSQDDVKQFRTNILGFSSEDADKAAALRIEENKIHYKFLLKPEGLVSLTQSFLRQMSNLLRTTLITERTSEKDRTGHGFSFVGTPLIQVTLGILFTRICFEEGYPKGSDLFEDFQTFLSVNLAQRTYGLPQIFDRRPEGARERMKGQILKSFKDWQPSDYVKGIAQNAEEAGLTDEGVLANEFDLIIASNINTIPITYISLLHIISDSALLGEIREELEVTRYRHLSHKERASLDHKEVPKLLALYHEVLRFHSTAASYRELKEDKTIIIPAATKDEQVRTYVLKKGRRLPGFLGWFISNNVIALPSSLTHHNPSIHENPETFDPKRFLAVEHGGKGTPVGSATLRAFGGGSSHCPGRVFAQKQIVGFLAMVVLNFDLEIVSEGWEIPRNADFYFVTKQPDVVLRIANRRPGPWNSEDE